MELLLIRHALPRRVDGVTGDAPADPPLAELGVAQTDRLAEYLAAERLVAVYTSPLRRARQTAGPVAARHDLTPIDVDGVAEFDRNAPDYVPVEELKGSGDPRWDAMMAGDWMFEEEPDEFNARVLGAIEAVVARHPGAVVAVVCHGGVINSYLSHVLGRREDSAFFYPNYTSIHRIAAARSGERAVLTINETAHLRGTGLLFGLFQRDVAP